jgi:hypothetical protein
MVKGILRRDKCYVDVIVRVDTGGKITPLSIEWADGRVFEIDKVIDARKCASLKVGGIGTRYICEIKGTRTYLFYEEPLWFVEQKVYE